MAPDEFKNLGLEFDDKKPKSNPGSDPSNNQAQGQDKR